MACRVLFSIPRITRYSPRPTSIGYRFRYPGLFVRVFCPSFYCWVSYSIPAFGVDWSSQAQKFPSVCWVSFSIPRRGWALPMCGFVGVVNSVLSSVMGALMVETPQSVPTAPSMHRHTMRVVLVIDG